MFLFAVQLAWQDAKFFLEALGEIGWGGKSYGIGYLGNTLVCGLQKCIGTLETLLAQQLDGRDAGKSFYLAIELYT